MLHGKQWKATRAGRQIKSWHKAVSEIVSSIGYDVHLEPDLSVKAAGKVLRRVVSQYDENQNALNADKKSELKLYTQLNEKHGFKSYLRGPMTLGKRLKFKFRSGSIPLNAKMAKVTNSGDAECKLCYAEKEDPVHFLMCCHSYTELREEMFTKIQNLDANLFQTFRTLNDLEAAAALLSESYWENYTEAVDEIVKDFLAAAWKVRCNAIYGSNSHYRVTPNHTDNVRGSTEGFTVTNQHHPNGCGVHGHMAMTC